MNLPEALTRIIDDGIAAATESYSKPGEYNDKKLEGALRGFEECRGLDQNQIRLLLSKANAETTKWYGDDVGTYWYWRCRALEIEWVANVLSAILVNEGHPAIVPVTARGVLKAHEVLSGGKWKRCNYDTPASYDLQENDRGRGIRFQPCGVVSFNEHDVRNHYCAHCHRFVENQTKVEA